MSNPTPITPTVIAQPVRTHDTITAAQLEAFQSLLASSGLIALPSGKTAANIVGFSCQKIPNGNAILDLAIS